MIGWQQTLTTSPPKSHSVFACSHEKKIVAKWNVFYYYYYYLNLYCARFHREMLTCALHELMIEQAYVHEKLKLILLLFKFVYYNLQILTGTCVVLLIKFSKWNVFIAKRNVFNMNKFCDWLSVTKVISVHDSFF